MSPALCSVSSVLIETAIVVFARSETLLFFGDSINPLVSSFNAPSFRATSRVQGRHIAGDAPTRHLDVIWYQLDPNEAASKTKRHDAGSTAPAEGIQNRAGNAVVGMGAARPPADRDGRRERVFVILSGLTACADIGQHPPAAGLLIGAAPLSSVVVRPNRSRRHQPAPRRAASQAAAALACSGFNTGSDQSLWVRGEMSPCVGFGGNRPDRPAIPRHGCGSAVCVPRMQTALHSRGLEFIRAAEPGRRLTSGFVGLASGSATATAS